MQKAKRFGLALVVLFFLGGGVAHFIATDFFLHVMPPQIPYPRAAIYLSGIFELLGAIGVLLPQTRQIAGNCLILLTFCVTPVNVYMWLHPDLFPEVSSLFLSGRLMAQVFLVADIWWSTRTEQQSVIRSPVQTAKKNTAKIALRGAS